jgi:hypothetical protein
MLGKLWNATQRLLIINLSKPGPLKNGVREKEAIPTSEASKETQSKTDKKSWVCVYGKRSKC